MLRLKNTLTEKVENFKPIQEGKVGMYNCGPTVYDDVHIGNLRSFVMADLIRRTLEFSGYKVTQVMNITDIGHLSGDNDSGEDKMTKGLKREGKPLTLEAMKELADFYANRFKKDLEKLNIKTPHHFPKASEHVKEDVELIKILEEKGFTYKTKDGIYFDTTKDESYGQLGGINSEGKDVRARISTNNEKQNQRDFALWKFNENIGFESPWGKGFPGWHIECSAMSRKYLGDHFDIHTGGIDLASIHHNNEIAQSQNACSCQFVNYWVHNAFVNVTDGKMAKSEGNTLTLDALTSKGINPLSYRYWLLQAHYSSPINFTWEAIEGSQNGYKNLATQIKNLGKDIGTIDPKYRDEFTEIIQNDIDTPQAIALVWKLLKDDSVPNPDKKATILYFDKVFGLDLDNSEINNSEISFSELPEDIKELIKEREIHRKSKDWEKSDSLRKEIAKRGYELKDTGEGVKILSI